VWRRICVTEFRKQVFPILQSPLGRVEVLEISEVFEPLCFKIGTSVTQILFAIFTEITSYFLVSASLCESLSLLELLERLL